MNTLENIGNLVERLAGKIEAITDDRENMFLEINRLRECLIKSDKEAVKAAREMRAELETARMDVLRFEQERTRMNVKLQKLNDRLTSLADAVTLPRGEKYISEAEKTLG